MTACKGLELEIWLGLRGYGESRRTIANEWSVIQSAANKILEDGAKREFYLQEVRTIKRRAAMKQKLLKERRENEEAALLYRTSNMKYQDLS